MLRLATSGGERIEGFESPILDTAETPVNESLAFYVRCTINELAHCHEIARHDYESTFNNDLRNPAILSGELRNRLLLIESIGFERFGSMAWHKVRSRRDAK